VDRADYPSDKQRGDGRHHLFHRIDRQARCLALRAGQTRASSSA
jgi:hypothetical protein